MEVGIFRDDDEVVLFCIVPHGKVIGSFEPYISDVQRVGKEVAEQTD